ncbi:hypothetical protein HETIRDRAFT_428372 [Heterobasidion irregulare TC 32-1]|uniref:Carbohydrate-binding module family 19 domain-containing protein n=1 Tax=Heterobasidion irregulare (strain TC 32-1) TaxID=747525 RepID=W4K316_HETIT|nr:uncharacterized protein HETIRDRAFT_428372 [Heterobasidion irregulare TC 32-1]ETW80213.1 hypothetical protein HETIRDRAFT_428372 [Heterobasidion irregulare TC 32-1]
MVHLSAFLVALVAVSTTTVHAAPGPLTKRIAQTISDSTKKWEAACDTAGGAQQCNSIAVTAFGTLLAAAGPCDQQDNADKMIDLAKQLNSDADMIKFAQIFAQQPRNTPTSQSVPYCQTAPKNAELNGLYQCQFAGANPKTFVGGTAVGGAGTVPLGMSAPLSPAGSCPAHPAGPIADGTQLADQVSSSGAGSSAGSSNSTSGSDSGNSTDSGASGSSDGSGDEDSGDDSQCGDAPATAPATATVTATVTVTVTAGGASATATAAPTSNSSSTASSANSSFLLQNGEDAQALNKKFSSLDANSTCTEGDQACIGTAFAQCVGGAFVQTQCSSTLVCAALPLVNKAGTTIACTTQADAASRIAATGATGGIAGDSSSAAFSSSPASSDAGSSSASASASAAGAGATFAATSGSGSGFLLQNGKDAQALNKQFQSLTADSSCTDGQNACIGDAFAQCVGGAFVQSQCGSGLTCAALPLVNSAGTSIACVTQAEAASRIAATGATGGVTGN